MILASVTNSAIWSNASIPWFCFFQNFVFYNFHLAGTKIILPLYKLCYKLMPKSVNNMADSRWCYNSVLKFRMLRQIIKTRQTSLILLAGGVCGDDVIRLLVHIAGNVVKVPVIARILPAMWGGEVQVFIIRTQCDRLSLSWLSGMCAVGWI